PYVPPPEPPRCLPRPARRSRRSRRGAGTDTDLGAAAPRRPHQCRPVVAQLFGKFGNRLPPSDPGTAYPVRTEVVRDATPLQLVGGHGRIFSAVGLHAGTSSTPYDPTGSTGPRLTGAKLPRMSARGDTAPRPFRAALPNDGVT